MQFFDLEAVASNSREELTMDSSNSPLNVTVWSLRNSPHHEDHKQAEKCEQILNDVLALLKPILRYVCTPRKFYNDNNMNGIRCLLVGTYIGVYEQHKDRPVHVFLSEFGVFFEAQKEAVLIASGSNDLVMLGAGGARGEKVAELVRNGYNDQYCTWNQLPFDELITNLRNVLAEAEEKRQQHLKTVADRREVLDQIIAVMRSLPPAIVHAEFDGYLLCEGPTGKSLATNHYTRPDDIEHITCEVCKERAPQFMKAAQYIVDILLSTNLR